ncbi:MAG: alginate O-acetyltransferase AlgX-related protein [Pyrinomonadaceae bacterium]
MLLCALLGAVSLSPVAVGALGVIPYAPAGVGLVLFAAYAFGRARGRLSKQVSVVLLSACFAVTLFDLAARPLLLYLSSVRPSERYIYRWPEQPLLQRYVAGVHFEGLTYGDLAAVSGRGDWREWHPIRFLTDEYGFRNEPPAQGSASRPLDLILLGDSFGVAAATTQGETLSGVLARDYGLNVYNLSISRESPQQEYANLVLEGGRLKTREGTRVLWLVFTGNDLDDPYYKELEDPQPTRPSAFARIAVALGDFRARSPVRRLLTEGDSALIIERRFVDGRRVLFHKNYAERRGRTAEEIMRHPNFVHLKATLGAMERLAAARRLKVSVALVPSKEEVYSWLLDGAPPWRSGAEPSGFAEVMRGLCEQQGFGFLDLKPALVEESRREFEQTGALLWWPDDTHWNEEGQRAAARAVYQNLLDGTRDNLHQTAEGIHP